MKFYFLLSVLFSINAFAAQNGYVCVGASQSEAIKLERIAPDLREDYLFNVGVLVLRAQNCKNYKNGTVCTTGPFRVNVSNNYAELILSRTAKIKLACDVDAEAGPFPSMGGSN
jgi:hypothetical protein